MFYGAIAKKYYLDEQAFETWLRNQTQFPTRWSGWDGFGVDNDADIASIVKAFLEHQKTLQEQTALKVQEAEELARKEREQKVADFEALKKSMTPAQFHFYTLMLEQTRLLAEQNRLLAAGLRTSDSPSSTAMSYGVGMIVPLD